MKLSQDHIQELYKFTRAHYVEHFDLQTELVDHLCNGIEEQWAQHPELTFEEAKVREFKKFGKVGFKKVIAARRKAMGKKYRGIIWGYFKEWWSFPRICITVFTIFLLFFALQNIPAGDLRFGTVLGVFFLVSFLMFCKTFQLRRKMEGLWRKWALQEMIYEQGIALQLFVFPVYFLNLAAKTKFLDNFYGQFIIAFLMVVTVIVFIILTFTIPSKAEQLLAKTYPEYKIS
jgi:hypothetical protein